MIATQNESWGFWGTMRNAGYTDLDACWADAFAAIKAATSCDDHQVRAFLDSRSGRHFADDVIGYGMNKAIARWMGWTISENTSRDTGIPAGMPYLTGFVINEGIHAEAAE
jgi:hypothetical protein